MEFLIITSMVMCTTAITYFVTESIFGDVFKGLKTTMSVIHNYKGFLPEGNLFHIVLLLIEKNFHTSMFCYLHLEIIVNDFCHLHS